VDIDNEFGQDDDLFEDNVDSDVEDGMVQYKGKKLNVEEVEKDKDFDMHDPTRIQWSYKRYWKPGKHYDATSKLTFQSQLGTWNKNTMFYFAYWCIWFFQEMEHQAYAQENVPLPDESAFVAAHRED